MSQELQVRLPFPSFPLSSSPTQKNHPSLLVSFYTLSIAGGSFRNEHRVLIRSLAPFAQNEEESEEIKVDQGFPKGCWKGDDYRTSAYSFISSLLERLGTL